MKRRRSPRDLHAATASFEELVEWFPDFVFTSVYDLLRCGARQFLSEFNRISTTSHLGGDPVAVQVFAQTIRRAVAAFMREQLEKTACGSVIVDRVYALWSARRFIDEHPDHISAQVVEEMRVMWQRRIFSYDTLRFLSESKVWRTGAGPDKLILAKAAYAFLDPHYITAPTSRSPFVLITALRLWETLEKQQVAASLIPISSTDTVLHSNVRDHLSH